jgi:hypothetical protein
MILETQIHGVISVMVLMKGVQIGTLYKLLGNVDSIGCDIIVVPEVASTQAESIQLL